MYSVKLSQCTPSLFSPCRHFALSFWKPLELLCFMGGELNAWILISGRQNAKGYDDILINPECNRVGCGMFLADMLDFHMMLETQKGNAAVSCEVLWTETRNSRCYSIQAFVWPVCDYQQTIIYLVALSRNVRTLWMYIICLKVNVFFLFFFRDAQILILTSVLGKKSHLFL